MVDLAATLQNEHSVLMSRMSESRDPGKRPNQNKSQDLENIMQIKLMPSQEQPAPPPRSPMQVAAQTPLPFQTNQPTLVQVCTKKAKHLAKTSNQSTLKPNPRKPYLNLLLALAPTMLIELNQSLRPDLNQHSYLNLSVNQLFKSNKMVQTQANTILEVDLAQMLSP